MDYEKEYNEAFERGRKVILDSTEEEKNVAYYILPQLKEVKDEIIKNRLIEYFESYAISSVNVKWEGLNVQDILIYLKK